MDAAREQRRSVTSDLISIMPHIPVMDEQFRSIGFNWNGFIMGRFHIFSRGIGPGASVATASAPSIELERSKAASNF